MPAPISQKTFDGIFALLNPGEGHERLEQREIALHSGVSERTVWSIANGRIARPGLAADPSPKSRATQPRIHDGVKFVLVAPYRCAGCRMTVTLSPCLYCHQKAKRGQS